MNEIKLATKVTEGRASRLAIQMNMKDLDLPWEKNDIIRVMSYKEDGTLLLKRVGKKSQKTVAHTLTKTGGGAYEHDLGIFVAHKPTRFRAAFKPSTTVSAAARFLDKKQNILQIFIPKEIYQ